MKAREYEVLNMAVEQGVAYGLRRVRKYNENPTDAQIEAAIEAAVLNAIGEWFTFDEVTPDE